MGGNWAREIGARVEDIRIKDIIVDFLLDSSVEGKHLVVFLNFVEVVLGHCAVSRHNY